MPTRFSRPVPRWTLVSAGVVAVVGVVATVAAATTAFQGTPAQPRVVQATAAATPPSPPADVSVANVTRSTLPWDKPLTVTVSHGKLIEVRATQDDGVVIAGSMAADATRWQSSNTLVPLSRIALAVTYRDDRSARSTKYLSLAVGDSLKHLRATITPGDGAVVGVGMPVVVTFSRTVPEAMRTAVERRLTVTTSPHLDGAWHWFSGEEVHWRPPAYWPAGTKVTVHTDLSRLPFGDGIWGADEHTAAFSIGSAHLSKVDVAGHVMRVYDGGTLVRTMPISAGRDKYPTMGGVHIALDKAQMVIMDSATVGIPKGDPDYYYEKVYWNVRISNGGAFVHAAPWSVADQGRANVSHGCINLSPSNATWFYNFSRRGDVVDIVNTPRGPSSWDAGTMDWNMSWAQWVAGS